MLRPQGQLTVFGDFRTIEADTVTCGHCNVVVQVKPGTASTVYVFPQMDGPPKEEMGAHCRVCDKPVCLRCCDVGVCRPFMKRIEAMERGRTWHDPLPVSVGISRG
jgi:hypothetical protein